MTRDERAGFNEATFRKVNEAIQPDAPRSRERPIGFVCECAQVGCNDVVHLTVAEYERVRSNPLHFFCAPEHDDPEREIVVERRDTWWLLEKTAPAAVKVAQDTYPRPDPDRPRKFRSVE